MLGSPLQQLKVLRHGSGRNVSGIIFEGICIYNIVSWLELDCSGDHEIILFGIPVGVSLTMI